MSDVYVNRHTCTFVIYSKLGGVMYLCPLENFLHMHLLSRWLDYCNQPLLSKVRTLRLTCRIIQKSLANIITITSTHEHITLVHISLHWCLFIKDYLSNWGTWFKKLCLITTVKFKISPYYFSNYFIWSYQKLELCLVNHLFRLLDLKVGILSLLLFFLLSHLGQFVLNLKLVFFNLLIHHRLQLCLSEKPSGCLTGYGLVLGRHRLMH